VYWKVRIWDRHGRPTAYSAPAVFEMGLLKASDWHGSWVSAPKSVSAPLLRREFSIDAPIRSARAYVSGLGYYELYINGRKVGDRVLEPASTYYNNDQPFKLGSRVLYSTYDVTDAVKNGANALGVVLGHGWYSAEADASFRTPYGDRPRLMFQLDVELADGGRFRVVSDPSWKTSAGPITYNDLSHGETYDARLEQPGWDTPGFDDSAWANATLAEPLSGVLTAQTLPSSKVMQTLPVVKVLTPREPEDQFFANTIVYDFGQNFTGWVRMAVSGPRGATLTLRYGARIDPEDDTLDNRSNATPDAGARQTDSYILKGEGTELWEPRFTEHGFRYVEVRGDTEASSVQKIEGRFARSAVDSTGSFESSNALLNIIHHNIQWTFMNSLQGLPQDAAERAEREGWLGDPGFVAEDYLYNYDMVGFWEKWLQDIRDSQRNDGALPIMAPMHLRAGSAFYEPYGKKVWPSWQSTYPLLVWYLYQYYGDRQVLEDHYLHVKKLVELTHAAALNGLIADEPLGDHMEPQDAGFTRLTSRHTPPALTANAYYYFDVFLLARIAEILGRSGDAKKYDGLSLRIKAAFNRKFFNSQTNQYATGSQTANALPLYVGLVPREDIPAVLNNLVDDVVVKHGNHVSTGIIGTNAVVQVLPQHGATNVMYQIATQTTYPSLGQQVMKGATTVCENYECSPWTSQNMKMFGSLDKFFYRNLAGIAPASPGYRRVLIRPQPVGDLKTVTASERTVRGTVSVDWTKGTTSFDLKVTIPAGMEANIAIPKLGLTGIKITEDGTIVWQADAYVAGIRGLTGAQADTDSIVLHTGSGSYHFILNGSGHAY
jgi:alpha-L-rhamnosidase